MSETRAGLLYAGSAFFIWGIVPFYFLVLKHVSAFEILAHRVFWSVLFLLPAAAVTSGLGIVRRVFAQPGALARFFLSAALIAANWVTFVWAVVAGRVLETSLGYFLTPQVNIFLGFVFLGERLRPLQWLAVALSVVGVSNQVLLVGELPWVSLVLAVTFGCYGLVRKQIAIDSINGLLIETLLALPFALGYFVYLFGAQRMVFGAAGTGLGTNLLLALLGLVTAIPLLLFTAGARRLRLVTLGFMQYLAPSMTFVEAVFLFGEPLGFGRAATFLLIWVAIAIYAFDSWRLSR